MSHRRILSLVACSSLGVIALLCGCPPAGGVAEDCSIAIPANAQVVDDVVTADASGGIYWVCDGGNLTINNGELEVFAESGAAVTTNGGTVDLWARAGSNVTANAGDGEYNIEGGANFTGYGAGITEVACSSLAFDLTDAPEPGCD